ncbi:MAG: choice-of-anchor L domain-containing protein [Firmicutes bacterium]|nr:choice-of-anchor L domain-containing protein [Bacillota bacterium]
MLAVVFLLMFAIGSPGAWAQESDQHERTFGRVPKINPVANNSIKIQGFEDIDDIDDEDDWDYSEKGTKYIVTKDLSEQTAEQLVQQIMGADVQILNVRYTGTDVSAGSFRAVDESIIGFSEGVMLSTGNIRFADGPNIDEGITEDNNGEGDQYLDLLIPGYETFDATILEFDFIPSKNTLSFEYVFSSDEYNEYVGTEYNDVFGFFLNGRNIALIPNTDTPVAINNVNNNQNKQYYRDNTDGQIMTEMDGLTTVLTVTATVKVGEMNTIRMAIADAGDYVLDSNVFVKGASFTSIESDVLQFSKPTQEVNEDGGKAMITVTRTGNAQKTVTVEYYTNDGSAKAPDEYLAAAGTLVFEPGVTSKTIPVTIVDNGIPGDIKTFYVYLRNTTGNAIIGNNIRTRLLIMDDDTTAGQEQTVLWEEKTNVPTNKNYIINFSAEIDPETVTPNNFYIKDEAGQKIPNIVPRLTFNKLSVIMKADGFFEYQPGQTYTLIISPNVKSQAGSPLGRQIKMYFTINDLI